MRALPLLLLTGCPFIFERPVDPTDPTTVPPPVQPPVIEVVEVAPDGLDLIVRVRLSGRDGRNDLSTVALSDGVHLVEQPVSSLLFEPDGTTLLALPWLDPCMPVDLTLTAHVSDRSGLRSQVETVVTRVHSEVDTLSTFLEVPFTACGVSEVGDADCVVVGADVSLVRVEGGVYVTISDGTEVLGEGEAPAEFRFDGIPDLTVCARFETDEAWAMEVQ